jgi:hypothetical protein
MSIENFLLNLDREISRYTEYTTTKESKTVNERRLLMLKLINVNLLYKIITFYFNDTGISSDENIMTSDEIQIIINKINNLMGTYLEVDI